MVRRKISSVWSHFTLNKIKNIAKCNKCKKEYKTSGNTTNLRDHLNRFHSTESEDEDEDIISSTSTPKIPSFFKKQNMYDSNNHLKK